MRSLNLFIIAIFAIILTSCSSYDIPDYSEKDFKSYMDSWLGAHVSELLMPENWGTPEKETNDGKGGRIIRYEEYFSDISINQSIWDENDWEFSDNSYLQYWHFYVDKNGIIVRYQYGTK